MAGVGLEFSLVGDREVNQALVTLKRQLGDADQALRQIGEKLIESTERRIFEEKATPWGEPWDELGKAQLAKKVREKKNPDKILVYSGDMAEELRYQVDDDELRMGSNKVYAARMHYGDDQGTPAREWLGFSEDDLRMIRAVVMGHLNRAIGGAG